MIYFCTINLFKTKSNQNTHVFQLKKCSNYFNKTNSSLSWVHLNLWTRSTCTSTWENSWPTARPAPLSASTQQSHPTEVGLKSMRLPQMINQTELAKCYKTHQIQEVFKRNILNHKFEIRYYHSCKKVEWKQNFFNFRYWLKFKLFFLLYFILRSLF